MTVAMDQQLTVHVTCGDGGVDPEMDETDDVVMKYLERWVDTNGRTLLPRNDPCSAELLQAMQAVRPDAVTIEPTG
jgi:hypothetical protein